MSVLVGKLQFAFAQSGRLIGKRLPRTLGSGTLFIVTVNLILELFDLASQLIALVAERFVDLNERLCSALRALQLGDLQQRPVQLFGRAFTTGNRRSQFAFELHEATIFVLQLCVVHR